MNDDYREKEKLKSAFIHFDIYLTRRTLFWGLAGIVVCAAVYGIFSDTLTMTAYYPSPQGVYWKLWSTADTILGRDQFVNALAPSVVQVGGDSVKGKYNATPNVLTVYGNSTFAKNPNISGTGNLIVQGALIVPTVNAGGSCSGGAVQSDGSGALYYCKNGTWQQASGGTALPPSGTVFTVQGTNPSCPSGSAMGGQGRYWLSTPCASAANANYCANLGNKPTSCSTAVGWNSSTPSCVYVSWGYVINAGFCGAPSGRNPQMSCCWQYCYANSWTEIQCVAN